MRLNIASRVLGGFALVVCLGAVLTGVMRRGAEHTRELRERADEHEVAATSMVERTVDHLQWMAKLDAAVMGQTTDLNVQMDPAKCRLGRWLGAFHDFDDHAVIGPAMTVLRAADGPHHRLHASAKGIRDALKAAPKTKAPVAERVETAPLAAAVKAHQLWEVKLTDALLTRRVAAMPGPSPLGAYLKSEAFAAQPEQARAALAPLAEAVARLDSLTHLMAARLKAGAFGPLTLLWRRDVQPARAAVSKILSEAAPVALVARKAPVESGARALQIRAQQTLPALKGVQKQLLVLRGGLRAEAACAPRRKRAALRRRRPVPPRRVRACGWACSRCWSRSSLPP